MINIRPFHPDDEAAVIALWHYCELIVPWNDPKKDIARKLKVNPELFLVAENEAGIAGTVMGGYEGHRGWMNYLAVIPELQGTGIARQLIERIERDLLALGCPKINLQVRSSNTSVIEFYRQLGYAEDNAVSLGKRLIPDKK